MCLATTTPFRYPNSCDAPRFDEPDLEESAQAAVCGAISSRAGVAPALVGVADKVQRAAPDLVVDPSDVLAENTDGDQLHARQQQHEYGQRGPALDHRDVARETQDGQH